MRPRGRNERPVETTLDGFAGAGWSSASNLADARAMGCGLGANGLRLVADARGVAAGASEREHGLRALGQLAPAALYVHRR